MHPQLVPQLAPLPRAGRRSRPAGLVPGTPVATTEGEIPVEFLLPGDLILTGNGPIALRGTSTLAALEADVVTIAPGAPVGGQRHSGPALLLAASQMVLIRDWRAAILHGQDRMLTPASSLVDGLHIQRETRARLRLIRLHFDAPQVIRAGGLDLASARSRAPVLPPRWLH